MYGCKKYVGSRLQNTKKLKRFRKIVCSPKCKNTIRELRYLTYKKDAKGNAIYDEFNIDPHTFNYHNRACIKRWKNGNAVMPTRAEVLWRMAA